MANSQDLASSHHFDMHASIVFQLGDDLITDVVQAVIELVKNAYDADASFANILVESDKPNDVKDTFFPGALGFITVEDDGVGMDEATIQRGWLTISNSVKREMKRTRKITPEKGRTPLGDKGLGRLGVQKLGFNVELFTKPKGEDFEYHVGWSWKEFEGDSALSQIRPRFLKTPSRAKRGTRLLISAIKDSTYWSSPDRFADFQRKMSQILSPYRNFQDFVIAASVNGKEVGLAEITDRIRRLAHLRYKIDFDGRSFSVDGRASLGFIQPKTGEEAIAAFDSLVQSDDGERFLRFLEQQPVASMIKMRRARAASWFVEFGQVTPFTDIPDLRWIDQEPPTDSKIPANPGPFHAEVDAFDLSQQMKESTASVFDTLSTYRNYIKDLNGVRIFRDGFGVRVDRDWLGLASQWTGAQSYYALKPDNTLGFVALTARDNANLVETTDREGFKSTPHFENFMVLFGRFVKFAHDSQEFLRRGWLDFLNQHQRELANVKVAETPEQLHRKLADGLSRARSLQAPLADAISNLREVEKEASETLERAQSDSSSRDPSKELKSLGQHLTRCLDDAQALLGRLASFLDDVTKLRELALVLHDDASAIRTQLDEAYEVVSLGLTAEALSHEIHHIADTMAQRTQDMSRHLDRTGLADAKVLSYVEYIRVTVAALRKQMAHLAPSLKYVREKREQVRVREFFDEIKQFFEARWEGEPIKIEVRQRGEPLVLNINRGKLTQICDNLILNSEYWIREELKTGRIREGVVSIDIAHPTIRISDNGPGIDPLVENTLFEPFVSRKPRQKGRGLGLFIVRQLLDSESCVITLSPRRNDRGRLFRFEIDFSGAMND